MTVDYLALLREMLKNDQAQFMVDQREAIERAVAGERILVVEKTGWGKSIVYFLVTKVLRDAGKGMTIIISPLLSLMSDQIRHAVDMGLVVETINSNNTDDHDRIYERIKDNAVDALLISPERLSNSEFKDRLFEMTDSIGLLVVDEAHCISDWGHDFRPDYRRIVDVIDRLPSNIPVIATTATANDRVVEDISEQISGMSVIRGPLTRDSIALQTIQTDSIKDRLLWLGANVDRFNGPGIIYCSTVMNCEMVCSFLTSIGKRAAIYVGKMSEEERVAVINSFIAREDPSDPGERIRDIDIVVATTALGMGFDMGDLKYVIHFEKPANIITYYQQIGRAGRGIPEAYAIMLYGDRDDKVNKYFIDNAFPEIELMDEIINVTMNHQDTGIRFYDYARYIDARETEIKSALKHLEVDGYIFSENKKYYRSAKAWTRDDERARRITARKYEELEKMTEYTSIDTCYMRYIANALDDANAVDCGKCSNCLGRDVISFAASSHNDENTLDELIYNCTEPIKPKKLWPKTDEIKELLGIDSYKIAPWCNQEGICLCRYGTLGYGEMVQRGKYQDKYFSDELVVASENILKDYVRDNNITWVTAVDSINHPELVGSFAERLAARLDLPFYRALRKTKQGKQQKELSNSSFQMKNVYDTVEVCTDQLQAGNVLLIDDMVDSGWTFTVCGYKLKTGGSGDVYPFALANTSNR